MNTRAVLLSPNRAGVNFYDTKWSVLIRRARRISPSLTKNSYNLTERC